MKGKCRFKIEEISNYSHIWIELYKKFQFLTTQLMKKRNENIIRTSKFSEL